MVTELDLKSYVTETIVTVTCPHCKGETLYSLNGLLVPLASDHPAQGNPPDGVPV